jgi:hypothetical protein
MSALSPSSFSCCCHSVCACFARSSYYNVVNYTALVYFSALDKTRQVGAEVPLVAKFSQWVFTQTLNFLSHGARKYVLPGDVKSGFEMVNWPFDSSNNSLRLKIQYESAEGWLLVCYDGTDRHCSVRSSHPQWVTRFLYLSGTSPWLNPRLSPSLSPVPHTPPTPPHRPIHCDNLASLLLWVGLIPEDSDPCDDDDETLRGTVPLEARVFSDSENVKRFDLNSASGLQLQIGLAVVAVLDGKVRDIIYEAYSNGTVYLYFPYFAKTLGYDPSLAALFGNTGTCTVWWEELTVR